jgi:hypothetical protein
MVCGPPIRSIRATSLSDADVPTEVGVVGAGPRGPALLGCAVVRGEDQQRVVPLPQLFQGRTQSSEVLVDRFDHRGVAGHVAGVQALLIGGELVPGWCLVAGLGVAWRQGDALRDHPQFLGALMALRTDLVPACRVDVRILLDEVGRGVQRGVAGAMRQVQVERLCGIGGLAGPDHRDRLVGDRVGEVVVIRVAIHLDGVVVAHQSVGLVEVGEPVEDPVVAVEALLQGPRVARAGVRQVGVLGHVPLAGHQRRVAVVIAQDLRQRGRVSRQFGRVAGEARVHVADEPDARQLRLQPGQQRGARRRTQGRHVEVRQPQSLGGQSVDVRRVDLRTEAAEVGEPRVVAQDHDDVGRALGRRGTRRPPRFRLGHRSADRTLEPGVGLGRSGRWKIAPEPVLVARHACSHVDVAGTIPDGSSDHGAGRARTSPGRSDGRPGLHQA